MEYRPLNEAADEIRVITILPAADGELKLALGSPESHLSDIVCVRLEHVSLNDRCQNAEQPLSLTGASDERAAWGYNPSHRRNRHFRFTWGDYAALSYAWGDAADTVDIFVDGAPVKVTRNLEVVLRMLRDNKRMRGEQLWVDALCINQEDFVERGRQVKRMGNIFGGALRVLVWIGPAADDSDKVAELIEVFWTTLKKARRRPSEAQILAAQPQGYGYWGAYFHLISRPYWRRLWIIQELIMAPKGLQIYCGSKVIFWDKLHWLEKIIDRNADLFMDFMKREIGSEFHHNVQGISGNMIGLQSVVRSADHGINTLDIYRLVRMAFGAEATDKRDKVYGILGLIRKDVASQIDPNYNLPESDVFTAFTKVVIRATQSLNIIRNGGLRFSERKPSWVPDPDFWSAGYHKSPYFNAGGDVAQALGFCGGMLICKGLHFDVIDGLGQTSDGAQPNYLGDPISTSDSPSAYTENAYGNKNKLAQALWRTLTSTDGPPRWYAPLTSTNLLNIPWQQTAGQMSVMYQLSGMQSESDSREVLIERSCYREFEAFRQKNKSFKVAGIPFQDFFFSSVTVPEDLSKMTHALSRFVKYFSPRRLMTTSRGYVGGAPRDAHPGDIIYVLPGCCDPLVLRPKGECFEVVGPCYVAGIMQGEALHMAERGELTIVEIKLC
jgi:hypothetical protein